MDEEFNQYDLSADNMGDALNYLEDGLKCEMVFYNERPVSIELPTKLTRKVIETEPAVRGDTTGRVMKPAKLATGFIVQVPAFITEGEVIEIDTRTGEYTGRVGK
jgi:elongation factor P